MNEPSTPPVPTASWRRWLHPDLLYALCALLLALSLFRTELLPFVDYPQHLYLSRLLADYWRGVPEVQQTYETNLLSFNAGFHTLSAALGLLMPIASAGRLVLAFTVLVLAYTCRRLLRTLQSPPEYAFVVLMALPGYWLRWGFVNYGLGLGLGLLLVDLYARADRTWTWREDLRAAVWSLLTLWMHLLATALCLALTAALLMTRAARRLWRREPWRQVFSSLVRRATVLLVPVVTAALILARQESSHFRNYEYASSASPGEPMWTRLIEFSSLTTTLREDGLDGALLGVGLVLMLLGCLRAERRPTLEAVALFAVALLIYLLLPLNVWATSFVYPRLGVLVVLALAAACPPVRPPLRTLLAWIVPSLGVISALLFFELMGRASREMADLERLVSRAPAARITGLVWGNHLPSFAGAVLLHTPAYVAAYRGGEVAFSFTRTMSLPIHTKADLDLPRAPQGLEWRPALFDPEAPYAKAFPMLMIHTPDDRIPLPRHIPRLAANHPLEVVLKEGSWWLVKLPEGPFFPAQGAGTEDEERTR